MLCLNGFELYSRCVPLRYPYDLRSQISLCLSQKTHPMIVAIFTLQDFLAIFIGPTLTTQLCRIFLSLLLETGPPF